MWKENLQNVFIWTILTSMSYKTRTYYIEGLYNVKTGSISSRDVDSKTWILAKLSFLIANKEVHSTKVMKIFKFYFNYRKKKTFWQPSPQCRVSQGHIPWRPSTFQYTKFGLLSLKYLLCLDKKWRWFWKAKTVTNYLIQRLQTSVK